MDTRRLCKVASAFMISLLLSGCSKSDQRIPQDLGLGTMHEGTAKPEKFYISIGVESPPYFLQSCLEAPEYFMLSFGGWLGSNNLNTTAYYNEIIKAVSLLTWPAKSSLSFSLKVDEDLGHARVVPSSTLASDADYLIRIQKVGYVTPEREYTFFRVGSMPRIASIGFLASKTSPNELEFLDVTMSESVDVAKFVSALSVTDVTKATALSLSLITTSTSAWDIGFTPPKGTLVSTKLRITIGTDVGASGGLLLDGKYTGKSGSGGLAVDLTPSDYLNSNDNGYWVPDLSF